MYYNKKEIGTAVFSMPENAVDPQAWKRAANALVANFLYYYQYNGNTVEYCVEIVKQEPQMDKVKRQTIW